MIEIKIPVELEQPENSILVPNNDQNFNDLSFSISNQSVNNKK